LAGGGVEPPAGRKPTDSGLKELAEMYADDRKLLKQANGCRSRSPWSKEATKKWIETIKSYP
jgi:hypothetical protein